MNGIERLRQRLAVLPAPLRKLVVVVIGGTVLAIGVLMIVLPGPAVLFIPLGLAILSIEFVWARVLLKKAQTMAQKAAVKAGMTKLAGGQPGKTTDSDAPDA
jgi:uncharacterized protein (TIGR02611 family)